jgi:LysM repeat protein
MGMTGDNRRGGAFRKTITISIGLFCCGKRQKSTNFHSNDVLDTGCGNRNIISIGGKMTKSLILKTLAVILAVVLLQLALVPESQAQSGYGGGWGGGFYYTVHYGDTLFAICRRFGVDPYEIARVNGLPNPNHIYAGQVLYIPAGSYCQNCGAWYPKPQPRPHPIGCYNNCYQQPVRRHGCGNDCYQQDYRKDCGNNNCYQQGYGYDYTGYYYDYNYDSNYRRYSYTCGYNYNCY